MKKTVIVGATTNPSRYAYVVAEMLSRYNVPFVPIGIKKGTVFGEAILDISTKPIIEEVHTITLYIGPQHQPEWYDYILSLKPKRIIFNPGTENKEFFDLARDKSIEPVIACNLVLLSTGQF
ncbi:CoA-binding protein [Belliella sp. R4-6]|uniref:CoA-binding protein n=1 Tax=Belliella alkalica TaxID=1730871 RepID=A0ABS9V6V6_9BACT|nr:CoA-binding protein [Belliella alkalica]MCH7411954.1 CoA-binding protein [Belliella alkalica]